DWDFDYIGEELLQVTKKADSDGGYVNVTIHPFPVRASTDLFIALVKEQLLEGRTLGQVNGITNVPVTINGLRGDLLTFSVAGNTIQDYVFSVDNYSVEVTYNYGKLDRDKAIIDGIINSLHPAGGVPFATKTTYTSVNPKLFLTSNNKWPIFGLNSKTNKA